MNKLLPALQLLGIGFYVAVCIVGGIMGGWWLGGKRPVFIFIGLVIGLFLAFYGVYSMIRPLMKNRDNKEDKG